MVITGNITQRESHLQVTSSENTKEAMMDPFTSGFPDTGVGACIRKLDEDLEKRKVSGRKSCLR